jgi:hypothetical protein
MSSSRAERASDGSAQMPLRGEMAANSSSPQLSAIKYDGIGWGIRNRHTPSERPSCSALITTVSGAGARTFAS